MFVFGVPVCYPCVARVYPCVKPKAFKITIHVLNKHICVRMCVCVCVSVQLCVCVFVYFVWSMFVCVREISKEKYMIRKEESRYIMEIQGALYCLSVCIAATNIHPHTTHASPYNKTDFYFEFTSQSALCFKQG